MEHIKRKVSPRAPSLALDEAIKRAVKMYEAEGSHVTPLEVALRHIGYSSKNGAAVQAMASLGYWGLVERPKDGMVKVAKVVEDYQYMPDEQHRQALLIRFMRNPTLFANLLEKYSERLPSDGTLKYELIQMGFSPAAAASCLAVFKRSVEFSHYFDRQQIALPSSEGLSEVEESASDGKSKNDSLNVVSVEQKGESDEVLAQGVRENLDRNRDDIEVDRIPIRLAGGRRAWIEIPNPFFNADKIRLKKQIDLLLTEDEESEISSHSGST